MSDAMSQMKREFEADIAEYKLEPKSIKPSGVEYHDAINPSHYKHGHIETIDYMRAVATHEEYCGHLRLTAIKYLSRLGKKDKSSQEVGKAIWYLEKLKTALEEYETFMMDGEEE